MQIGQLQQRAWRGAPSQPAANSRGALVIRAFTQQTMDSRAAQHAVPNMQQPYKDLGECGYVQQAKAQLAHSQHGHGTASTTNTQAPAHRIAYQRIRAGAEPKYLPQRTPGYTAA